MSIKNAVIDLGTNTFHLLIVESMKDGKWRELYRERVYVHLAASGINKILDPAYHKGLDTLKHFKEIMRTHDVQDYKALGTAALRTAQNGKEFIDQVRDELELHIELIDGEKEATYIALGVDKAMGDTLSDYLIMDIGGGSVEFIHKYDKGVAWQKSYPIGIAVLKSQEFFKDPLTESNLKRYDELLTEVLKELFSYAEERGPLPLVGASGTFEALLQIVAYEDTGHRSKKLVFDNFKNSLEEITFLSLKERTEHPGIPDERAELISIASYLIYFVIKGLKTKEVYVSSYALKEGVLLSMK